MGILLGQQINLKLVSKGFTGSQTLIFSTAIGNGIINSILATNIYSGATIGTGPGPGIGIGKVVGLVGTVVGQNIFTMMGSHGIAGSQSLNTAMGIGEAFAEHVMSLGIVNSAGAPVAIGTGTGPITGVLGAPMGQMIMSMLSSSGMVGSQSLNLAMAIGDGIALSMSTAIVNTVITGVPSPPTPIPTAGVETGKLI